MRRNNICIRLNFVCGHAGSLCNVLASEYGNTSNEHPLGSHRQRHGNNQLPRFFVGHLQMPERQEGAPNKPS